MHFCKTVGLVVLAVILFGCSAPLPRTTRCARVQDPNLVPATVGLDARTFLCELSSSRRNTPDERAAARVTISRELRRIGLTPTEQSYDDGREVYYPGPYYWGDGGISGTNLFAELPATAPSQDWIIVGAHYDTYGPTPGADDNGSGVTAVLLVAAELVQLRHRYLNVAFVFFDQEEAGLVGSARYAQWLQETGRQVTVFHNIDMVGWDAARDRNVTIMFAEQPGPRQTVDDQYMNLYGWAAERMRDDPRRLALPNVFVRDYTNRGEHVTFAMHGFEALTLIEDSAEVGDFNPYYHQREDTCDRIDYDYLRMCAGLVATAVTEQLRM